MRLHPVERSIRFTATLTGSVTSPFTPHAPTSSREQAAFRLHQLSRSHSIHSDTRSFGYTSSYAAHSGESQGAIHQSVTLAQTLPFDSQRHSRFRLQEFKRRTLQRVTEGTPSIGYNLPGAPLQLTAAHTASVTDSITPPPSGPATRFAGSSVAASSPGQPPSPSSPPLLPGLRASGGVVH